MHTDAFGSPASVRGHRANAPLAWLRRLHNDILARAAERRSIDRLGKLDDRLLRDIGLTRTDVAALVERHQL